MAEAILNALGAVPLHSADAPSRLTNAVAVSTYPAARARPPSPRLDCIRVLTVSTGCVRTPAAAPADAAATKPFHEDRFPPIDAAPFPPFGAVINPLDVCMTQQQKFGGSLNETVRRIANTETRTPIGARTRGGFALFARGAWLTVAREAFYSCGYLASVPSLREARPDLPLAACAVASGWAPRY